MALFYIWCGKRISDQATCSSVDSLIAHAFAQDFHAINTTVIASSSRKIIEKFNMTAFSMQEVDKYGINEVVRRALDAIDPR